MKYFTPVVASIVALALTGCVSDLYLGAEREDPGDAGPADGDTTDAADATSDAGPVTDAACCDANDASACQMMVNGECECECEVDDTCVGATCEEADDS